MFYETVREHLIELMNFEVCVSDSCIFIIFNIILGLYIDDILIIGMKNSVEYFCVKFGERFKCKVESDVDDFIGFQMSWNERKSEVILHQSRMIDKIEEKLKDTIMEWKVRSYKTPFAKGKVIERVKDNEVVISDELQGLYRSTVGTLLYLTKHSRPDLSNSIREISKANKGSTKNKFQCLLRFCNWLFKNKGYGMKLKKWLGESNGWTLEAYSDSDWENDKDERKTVTGWVIFLCKNAISWGSRGKKVVTLASSHAEYTAVTEVFKEVLYMRNLMYFLM